MGELGGHRECRGPLSPSSLRGCPRQELWHACPQGHREVCGRRLMSCTSCTALPCLPDRPTRLPWRRIQSSSLRLPESKRPSQLFVARPTPPSRAPSLILFLMPTLAPGPPVSRCVPAHGPGHTDRPPCGLHSPPPPPHRLYLHPPPRGQGGRARKENIVPLFIFHSFKFFLHIKTCTAQVP